MRVRDAAPGLVGSGYSVQFRAISPDQQKWDSVLSRAGWKMELFK